MGGPIDIPFDSALAPEHHPLTHGEVAVKPSINQNNSGFYSNFNPSILQHLVKCRDTAALVERSRQLVVFQEGRDVSPALHTEAICSSAIIVQMPSKIAPFLISIDLVQMFP